MYFSFFSIPRETLVFKSDEFPLQWCDNYLSLFLNFIFLYSIFTIACTASFFVLVRRVPINITCFDILPGQYQGDCFGTRPNAEKLKIGAHTQTLTARIKPTVQ